MYDGFHQRGPKDGQSPLNSHVPLRSPSGLSIGRIKSVKFTLCKSATASAGSGCGRLNDKPGYFMALGGERKMPIFGSGDRIGADRRAVVEGEPVAAIDQQAAHPLRSHVA
jgi:hypothetical protein